MAEMLVIKECDLVFWPGNFMSYEWVYTGIASLYQSGEDVTDRYFSINPIMVPYELHLN